MKLKNLFHAQYIKSIAEISQVINENGLQATLFNLLEDLNAIATANEYLSNDIDLFIQFQDQNLVETNQIIQQCLPVQLNENHFNLLKDNTQIEIEIPDTNFQLSVSNIEQYPPKQLHQIKSGILIIHTNSLVSESEVDHIRLSIEDFQWIIITNESHYPAGFIRELGKDVLQMDSFKECPNNIIEILTNCNSEKRSLYQTRIAFNKIQKILSAGSTLLKQELKNSKSKKNLIQQRLTTIGDSRSFNPSEIIQSIKNIVVQYNNHYDKSINSNYEQFLSIGNSEFLMLLNQLNEDSIPIAEVVKIKNIELVIDEHYLSEFKNDLEKVLLKRFITDIGIQLDSLHQIEKDIEAVFKKHNYIYQKSNIKYLTESDFQQILHYTRSKSPNYSGIAALKGPMEYFNAARKFQMTFFMFLSMFGVSSVIKQYQYVSLPLSIVLLGIGVLNVHKNVNKERLENEEKEQKKVTEAMINFVKDVGSDVQRYWLKTLTDHFKTQLQNISQEVENQLKSYSQNQLTQSDEEKKKNQRLISTYDQNERKLESASRNFQPLERNLSRTISDLQSSYSNILRNEREERRKV